MLTLIARFLPSFLPLFSPSILIAVGVLVAAVASFTGWQGYRLGAAKLDAYKVEQFTAAESIKARQAKVTEKVVTRYIEVAGATQVRTEYIEREVANYAEQNPAGLCLDADWRRLHDSAALNTVSGPTGSPAGALRTPAAAGQGLGITDRR
jgi:hypothetical protein